MQRQRRVPLLCCGRRRRKRRGRQQQRRGHRQEFQGREQLGEENEDREGAGTGTPVYLCKLEDILLTGRSDDAAGSLTFPAVLSGTGRVGVASLDLDALHFHYNSPECMRSGRNSSVDLGLCFNSTINREFVRTM